MRCYKPGLKDKARVLRSSMTDTERKLWRHLRRKQINGLQFYRQRPLGKYIVDFYCPAKNLVIEIDGSQHFQENNIKKDGKRDLFLNRVLKLKVLRFNNLDVLRNIEGVVSKIFDEIK
jgi:very-short-patch-repair endonuclease